jgi:hypothetical protein
MVENRTRQAPVFSSIVGFETLTVGAVKLLDQYSDLPISRMSWQQLQEFARSETIQDLICCTTTGPDDYNAAFQNRIRQLKDAEKHEADLDWAPYD